MKFTNVLTNFIQNVFLIFLFSYFEGFKHTTFVQKKHTTQFKYTYIYINKSNYIISKREYTLCIVLCIILKFYYIFHKGKWQYYKLEKKLCMFFFQF
jgi:hypothetical protein